MENKFKTEDEIILYNLNTGNNASLKGIIGNYAAFLTIGNTYKVKIVSYYDWGRGREAAILVPTIYGGFVPAAWFIPTETHYLIHN